MILRLSCCSVLLPHLYPYLHPNHDLHQASSFQCDNSLINISSRCQICNKLYPIYYSYSWLWFIKSYNDPSPQPWPPSQQPQPSFPPLPSSPSTPPSPHFVISIDYYDFDSTFPFVCSFIPSLLITTIEQISLLHPFPILYSPISKSQYCACWVLSVVQWRVGIVVLRICEWGWWISVCVFVVGLFVCYLFCFVLFYWISLQMSGYGFIRNTLIYDW